MKQNSEYRAIAREHLKGQWNESAVTVLIYSCIIILCAGVAPLLLCGFRLDSSSLNSTSTLASLAVLPVNWGAAILFLDFLRGEPLDYKKVFSGYKSSIVWATVILVQVFTSLWMLLFIIPGIIKSYSYSMSFYLIKDDPKLEATAAIDRSMAMMKGHKMQFFLLDLSFIGWILLCMLTLGIGFFWLSGYIATAKAAFYEDLKAEYQDSLMG